MTEDSALKDFCLLKLTEFAHDKLTETMVASWILDHDCKVVVPMAVMEMGIDTRDLEEKSSAEMMEVCALTLHQKYYFVKSLSSSRHLSLD